jgi:hypothetical protein
MMFSQNKPRPVQSTTHISFDERDKTFRLYSGKSIYSFCISPELTLEHLHWGETIPAGYDLRYLCQSSRLTHFTTVEAAPDKFTGKIIVAADTLEEIQKTWKENKVWGVVDMCDSERIQKRRLENYSWRLMSKIAQEGKEHDVKHCAPHIKKQSNILSTKGHNLENNVSFNDLPQIDGQSPHFPKEKPKNEEESKEIAEKCHQIDKQFSFSELPAIEEGSPELTPVSIRKKFNSAASEANLFASKDNKNPKLVRLPKPRLMELLSQQRGLSAKKGATPQTFDRALGKIGKGGICCEYSDFGSGDFRSPSFEVVDNYNGSSIAPLRYRKHRIYKGKLPMPDCLPGIRCLNENEASTLVVTLADVITGVEVDLIYGNSFEILHTDVFSFFVAIFL